MAFTKITKNKLKSSGRFECCEVCGTRAPGLENNGLQAAHIVSDASGGVDDPDNAIVLCNQCAEVFDRFLKAKVAKAFYVVNSRQGKTYSSPPDWPDAEGRRAKGDKI